jgi:YD repeat-containing protein
MVLDEHGNPTSIVVPSAEAHAQTFDLLDRLATHVGPDAGDGDGRTTTYTFGGDGRSNRSHGPMAARSCSAVTFTYDGFGRRTGRTVDRSWVYADANSPALEYDESGVITADTNPGFQGGIVEPTTGARFGARDYDPATDRFTSCDPVLFGCGQANMYVSPPEIRSTVRSNWPRHHARRR